MSSELTLNAYILLGNALNYVAKGSQLNYEAELNASKGAVHRLYGAIEPLRPADILNGLHTLSAEQRLLLDRCCRYCLGAMDDDEVSAKLGLPRDVAESVLNQLLLEDSHA